MSKGELPQVGEVWKYNKDTTDLPALEKVVIEEVNQVGLYIVKFICLDGSKHKCMRYHFMANFHKV